MFLEIQLVEIWQSRTKPQSYDMCTHTEIDLQRSLHQSQMSAVIMKSFPLRYRPGPDDIRGSTLARRGVMFLLRSLSAASARASLPPSRGAHLLLQALLAGRGPQQL